MTMMGPYGTTLCVAVSFIAGVCAQCDIGNTTLTPGPSQGVVQISHSGSLGTICDQYFTNKAAAVVCRALGKPVKNAYRAALPSIQPEGVLDSLITRVKCATGSESSLCACNITYGRKTCSRSSLIRVVCTEDPVAVTWFHKGRWLASNVKVINVTEGDDISCAAIIDTARFMTTRIYVPGQAKALRSGSGKQTVSSISTNLSGLLTCSVSNWDFKDQANSTIRLYVSGLNTSKGCRPTVNFLTVVFLCCLSFGVLKRDPLPI